MSRTVVHPTRVSRTGTSRAVKTQPVKYVTVPMPSFCRYASGVQTVVTGAPPN